MELQALFRLLLDPDWKSLGGLWLSTVAQTWPQSEMQTPWQAELHELRWLL